MLKKIEVFLERPSHTEKNIAYTLRCSTIQEAVDAFVADRDKYNFGARDYQHEKTGHIVHLAADRTIARISYNGKVWLMYGNHELKPEDFRKHLNYFNITPLEEIEFEEGKIYGYDLIIESTSLADLEVKYEGNHQPDETFITLVDNKGEMFAKFVYTITPEPISNNSEYRCIYPRNTTKSLLRFETAEEGKAKLIEYYAVGSETTGGEFMDYLLEHKDEEFHPDLSIELINEAVEAFREWDKEDDERDIDEEVKLYLGMLFMKIGIDRPSNYDEIHEFIVEDVQAAADPENYHTGDMDIAFRRFLESKRD